ncbi:MAG: 3-hydroxyacyl-ACP dehydratase FabZ [Firmicutes bacterium]|nr:3-hydroxyacyl-ACP dehydratase FabZ [Bacillota bacterium]
MRPVDLLPHRPPFLFVDEILELDPGRRAVACWRPSPDAEWVPAHFPGHPLVPGVLLVEALAQSGALAVLADPAKRGMLPVFAGLDRVRFRRPVRPGETVHLEVELLQARRTAGRGRGVARVGGETAVEGELLFVLLPRP